MKLKQRLGVMQDSKEQFLKIIKEKRNAVFKVSKRVYLITLSTVALTDCVCFAFAGKACQV